MCKHKNGTLEQHNRVPITYKVTEGATGPGEEAAPTLLYYIYHCTDCNRVWQFGSPSAIGNKWLQSLVRKLNERGIHEQRGAASAHLCGLATDL